MMKKTRFAPSPTGFLHIGSARTALFSWAFAQQDEMDKFVLRIEDTDLERSTQASVDSILDAMAWLNLDYDEGPYYQTKRMGRYKEVINKLLNSKKAYPCYCSKEELEQMREHQKSQGLKPKYDRRCLNNPEAHLGVNPVIRFKNPDAGSVIWNDLVKGKIEIANSELDDLIIARSDGSPTYNFCVVVDDLDMQITHVIRGDDHLNNTPRQINILLALGATIPYYAHLPMILREDGKKMSKRTDAVNVMQYKDMGILPEALLNYLARLCWGHNDDEIFTLEQFKQWFSLSSISHSPARFDLKKLLWVNKEHIQNKDNYELAQLVLSIWQNSADFNNLLTKPVDKDELTFLKKVIEAIKSRSENLNNLAYECSYFFKPLLINDSDKDKFLTIEALTILEKFRAELFNLIDWDLENIKLSIKNFCITNNLKMPQLGMPVRLKLAGTTQTPSLDILINLLGKEEVINRLIAN